MRNMSNKRAKQTKEYNKLCEELDKHLKEAKLFNCFFCDKPITGRADHHHLFGKENERLTDFTYIVIAHRECHSMFHDNPIKKIPWFLRYLDKLRDIDEQLFNREAMRINK